MIRHLAIPILLASLVSGCATHPRPSATASAKQGASVPTNFVEPTPEVRTAEVVRAYRVGAYVDPSDSRVRHGAHVIHRLEKQPTWNLRSIPTPKPLPDAERIRLADQQLQIRRQRQQAIALDAKAKEINQKLEAAGDLATTNRELANENAALRADLESAQAEAIRLRQKTKAEIPAPAETDTNTAATATSWTSSYN